jgi:hypothetical protein
MKHVPTSIGEGASSETSLAAAYNGWSSYETWAVPLWVDNELSSQENVRGLASDAWDEATETSYAPSIPAVLMSRATRSRPIS